MVHRIFHFDIKTLANYGDTILFELVRQTFNSFNGRKGFYVAGSSNLRATVLPALIDEINDRYDAVLIGGGGLFLSDTNANDHSGWQWDCSIEMLERLKKPIIVFAVGNNRFFGQAEFSDRFREHINLVVKKSIFFGLRNRGSVETIRQYLRPELRDRVVYQPCPTTLAAKLCPDLYDADLKPSKRLGVQAFVGKRQIAAGFNRDVIYERLIRALSTLQSRGWEIETFAHARDDRRFHEAEKAQGLETPLKAHNGVRSLFNPLKSFAKTPLTIGMRGHAQMVPFGMGNPIISLFVHDKLRYFLEDVGMPEFCVEVHEREFSDALVAQAEYALDNFEDLRRRIALKQNELLEITTSNLAQISTALGGKTKDATLQPYSIFERKLAQSLYLACLDKEAGKGAVAEKPAD